MFNSNGSNLQNYYNYHNSNFCNKPMDIMNTQVQYYNSSYQNYNSNVTSVNNQQESYFRSNYLCDPRHHQNEHYVQKTYVPQSVTHSQVMCQFLFSLDLF